MMIQKNKQMPCQIHSITDADRSWIREVTSRSFGQSHIISRGRQHCPEDQPGFIAWSDTGNRLGAATFHVEGLYCEITWFESRTGMSKIGRMIIAAIQDAAEEAGCIRLWLVTTNDDIPAICFFLEQGFRIFTVHANSTFFSRCPKPSVSIPGVSDQPTYDEIEFEMNLNPRKQPVPEHLPDFPQRLARRAFYESRWINLYLDRVRFPNGRIIDPYHLLDAPHTAVGALVSNEHGDLLMEQVYRYATGRLEWEIPAGGIEANEDILAAAQREILEETGLLSHTHRLLTQYNPANGSYNLKFYIISCQAGECIGEIDAGEIKGWQWKSRGEIEKLLKDGELQDGFTLTAILLWWWLIIK